MNRRRFLQALSVAPAAVQLARTAGFTIGVATAAEILVPSIAFDEWAFLDPSMIDDSFPMMSALTRALEEERKALIRNMLIRLPHTAT